MFESRLDVKVIQLPTYLAIKNAQTAVQVSTVFETREIKVWATYAK